MNKKFDVMHGDCLEVLKSFHDNSVDSVVTDPPYGFGFMGKHWDHGVPSAEVWRECLRVLKPGGYLLAFAGTRTQHRMACNIEDAGFEIRDMIAWVYSQGFPKSADVSKQIDQQEKNRWVKISKAIDKENLSEIAELWINSRSANAAGLSFQRNQTEAGLNMQKNGFAHGSVLLQASHKNCDALAVIAELNSTEAHRTSEGNCSFAQSNAESAITASKSHANTAESSPENLEATLRMVDFSALHSAWGWQGESKADKLKAVEALKIWLGSKPSSRKEATSALCAALTDDLKLITLSQSKTFLSFDTTRQMACASVISATITESTAESLISFTADTLRSKAIDKAAGAERTEVIGERRTGVQRGSFNDGSVEEASKWNPITAPATEAARQWQGWGTALKPSLEPVTVARKPLIGTVAENVLAHGTGAINIDGCRVEGVARPFGNGRGFKPGTDLDGTDRGAWKPTAAGRWPANLIHDGGEFLGDQARFFYCAKASRKDRNEGLGSSNIPAVGTGATMREREDAEWEKRNGNHHPTVKPTDLMRYLCRLVTPPGGVVLDPFAGSGSTGKAAMLEGFSFICIEREAEYVEIAKARICFALSGSISEPKQGELL